MTKPLFPSVVVVTSLALLAVSASGSGRINQEGRILGPAPVVTNSVLFDTPQADAITSAMQIFPVTNPWNEDVSRLAVLTNSDAMIAQIISDLAASRRTLRAFYEMNFVLAPDSQPLVPIDFVDYPDESDPSPYPIPPNMPIEGWPTQTEPLTLLQWQEDVNNTGGDRHSIVVQPGAGDTWETWEALLAGGTNWQAANGAKFNLNTNGLRPAGWTSGDAAGLSMFPALPRYDECERGMVEHACRLVVQHSRNQYIYPATHYASTNTSPNEPSMGQRLRLKSSFVIPSNWAKEETAILLALKKYGALVADNGNFFSISVTPDDRWPSNAFDHISTVGITNFEVVQSTGPNGGPRSPGAPVAVAGPDETARHHLVSLFRSRHGDVWQRLPNQHHRQLQRARPIHAHVARDGRRPCRRLRRNVRCRDSTRHRFVHYPHGHEPEPKLDRRLAALCPAIGQRVVRGGHFVDRPADDERPERNLAHHFKQ